MQTSFRMTNLRKWGIAVIILFFGILWLNTTTVKRCSKTSVSGKNRGSVEAHVVEVKFQLTLKAVSGQTGSMYQEEHPNFLNYFQERKKLVQFACKHARKLYAHVFEYTHKVYNIPWII